MGGDERGGKRKGARERERDVNTLHPNTHTKQSGFQCPTCKKSYGVKTGDMPDGTMRVRSLPGTRLPGHEDCSAIEITYNFSPGVYVSLCPLCVFHICSCCIYCTLLSVVVVEWSKVQCVCIPTCVLSP